MLLARLQLREEWRACRLCVSLKFTSQIRMEKNLCMNLGTVINAAAWNSFKG